MKERGALVTDSSMPAVSWTDDCQGKKGYDGPLIAISTRYWPSAAEQKRGNHFNALEHGPDGGIVFESHPYQANGLASAHAAITLRFYVPETTIIDEVDLIEHEFEGKDFEAVRTQVEEWVKEQSYKIVDILRRELCQS